MRKLECRPLDPALRFFGKTPARVCRSWRGVLFRQWQRCREAFELASVNLANRPTLRAFEQTYLAAIAAGLSEDAAGISLLLKKLGNDERLSAFALG